MHRWQSNSTHILKVITTKESTKDTKRHTQFLKRVKVPKGVWKHAYKVSSYLHSKTYKNITTPDVSYTHTRYYTIPGILRKCNSGVNHDAFSDNPMYLCLSKSFQKPQAPFCVALLQDMVQVFLFFFRVNGLRSNNYKSSFSVRLAISYLGPWRRRCCTSSSAWLQWHCMQIRNNCALNPAQKVTRECCSKPQSVQ